MVVEVMEATTMVMTLHSVLPPALLVLVTASRLMRTVPTLAVTMKMKMKMMPLIPRVLPPPLLHPAAPLLNPTLILSALDTGAAGLGVVLLALVQAMFFGVCQSLNRYSLAARF